MIYTKRRELTIMGSFLLLVILQWCLIIGLSVHWGWKRNHVEVKTAFWNADLNEEINVTILKGSSGRERMNMYTRFPRLYMATSIGKNWVQTTRHIPCSIFLYGVLGQPSTDFVSVQGLCSIGCNLRGWHTNNWQWWQMHGTHHRATPWDIYSAYLWQCRNSSQKCHWGVGRWLQAPVYANDWQTTQIF